MRKIAVLLTFVLATVMFAAAQYDNAASEDKSKTNDKSAAMDDKDKAGMMEMTGVVCNNKCVKQDGEKASCDAGCKEKSGDLVFVDDAGKSYKISNQKMAKKHAGKKVKMMGSMKGDEMDPKQIVDLGLGGG